MCVRATVHVWVGVYVTVCGGLGVADKDGRMKQSQRRRGTGTVGRADRAAYIRWPAGQAERSQPA